jgi:hypothetical protein
LLLQIIRISHDQFTPAEVDATAAWEYAIVWRSQPEILL